MTIGPFKGELRWLSNFWEAPIYIAGILYPSTEHLFQASKTFSSDEFKEIVQARTCGVAKRLGAKVTLRPDWEEAKLMSMRYATILKYTQHPDLGRKLVSTGDEEIVEYNTWHDNIWGVCTCENCAEKVGQNHLGKTLMEVRTILREYQLLQ